MVPVDAEKPADLRKEKKLPGQSLSSQLAHMIEATSVPYPARNPDAILKIVKEEKPRLQYEAELAYLRGDFARTMRCYDKTEGDEAARLLASPVAAAAISLGDYYAYLEIEANLKSYVDTGSDNDVSAFAELALASVAISVFAPNMVPRWLAEGDFSALRSLSKPQYLLHLRTKYFMCIGKYEIALAVAQSALAFSTPERGINHEEIYLRVVCALACHYLERDDEARRWLLEAMGIALPHGFITPFAEQKGVVMAKVSRQVMVHEILEPAGGVFAVRTPQV
jgi:tetratricopeptide (TPR) repeat protein